MTSSASAKIVFLIAVVFLLCNAIAISRDYQDSWVLEGLEIPFIIFGIAYAVTFFSVKGKPAMVVLAVIGSFVFALIPNLKYTWFLGRSIDQHRQYALANYVFNEGHLLPEQYCTGSTVFYARTPLIHLCLAEFSTVTGIPALHMMKLLPVLLSSIYPLLTHNIVRNLALGREKTVLRYALFISSIGIRPELSYIVTGSMFGLFFSFFLLSQIVKLLRRNSRRDWLVLIVFGCAHVIAHSFSSLQLALLILAVMGLQKFSNIRTQSYLRTSAVFLILALNLGWLMFQATDTLEYMTNQLANMGILQGIYPKTGFVPFRTFELAHVSIFEALKTTSVWLGADILLLLLMITAILLVAKNRRASNPLKFVCSFNALLALLLAVAVILGIGGHYWMKNINSLSILYGIFFGILAVHLEKRRLRPIIVFLLLVTMVLSTIQYYHFQPLVSRANVLSRDLPPDEPIVYGVQVNSIYQRSMISFAEDHVLGPIACDRVTTNQIRGLTEFDFSKTNLLWYYPLSKLLENTVPEKLYHCFLIHLPGKSGAFEEQAEIRSRSLILGVICSSSIVYTNAESFMLLNTVQFDQE